MSDVKRAVYRVVYPNGPGGQPAQAFVCATSDNEASAFLGIEDGSAQVSRVAYPVEVVGLDAAHSPLPSLTVTVAPFDLPRSVSRAEFDSLHAELADLRNQLAGQGKPVEVK